MGITISTLDYPEEFKARLRNQEKNIKSGNINFQVDEDKNEKYTLFKINYNDEKAVTVDMERFLADIVAEMVIDNLENNIIEKLINDYRNYNLREKKKIKGFAIEHLNRSEGQLDRIIRKKEIITQILIYFKKNKELNIEGFVRFRLKPYIQELKYAVQRAVDDFDIEKEYNEFIDLLKYFVDLQEPQFSLVNVIKKDDDSFQLLDTDKVEIQNEHLEKCIQELLETQEEAEFEDLLISALINISPAKIVLHFFEPEIEESLKNIFGERVQSCEGCSLCFSVKKN